jgi:hypothetical protein
VTRLRGLVLACGLIAGATSPSSAADEETLPVQDFEPPALLEEIAHGRNVAVQRVAAGKNGGSVLRGSIRAGESWADILLRGAPQDVTPYRTLRFRMRTEVGKDVQMDVRFLGRGDEEVMLRRLVTAPGKEWTTVEVALPEMSADDAFDPKAVDRVSFVWFDPPETTFEVDDVVLVKGDGGWRYTDKEERRRVFGAERLKKVEHVQTQHFDVFTDTAAALKKFSPTLEETYGFVLSSLGVGEMTTRLPVYVFQNPTLYYDFCVRTLGWSKEAAERSAGHGSGRYFATYYQSPKAPTVTHELTHSIFHRTVGSGGGSWFQEGVAVYVEHLAQGTSIAEQYAPRLRSRKHVPLAKLLAIERLLDEDDVRGGAMTANALYDQSGALFEFLYRGPLWPPPTPDGPAPKARPLPEPLVKLARLPYQLSTKVDVIEKTLGRSAADLEKAWIEWGSKPPKTVR